MDCDYLFAQLASMEGCVEMEISFVQVKTIFAIELPNFEIIYVNICYPTRMPDGTKVVAYQLTT